jgi:hypothetical protein
MRYLLLLLFLTQLVRSPVFAQDSVRVLFIYGSRPARAYRNSEPKWFGGIRGGHVGLQIGPDSVLNFRSTVYHPCHFFPRTHLRNFQDTFEIRTLRQSWEIFPPHHYNIDSLRRAIVVIPVTTAQRAALEAVIRRYDRHKPYDYATLGMRCASATYDVLQEAGLVPFHRRRNWLRYFAPRAFRREMFTLARKRQWKTYVYKGGGSRVWERDRGVTP